ncbi:hypothetical protein Tco_0736065 [Tanacetum coccineum]
MFHGKNVDFAELIWKDFQYQIDYKKSKLRRREIMPYPRFTKIIINYFLSLHKSIPKGISSGLNTIKDDGVIQRLKFVNKGEDFQEYGRAIPDTMLTDEIKQSKVYKAFIADSTGAIPPRKTRGKGSQGKKKTVTPKKKSFISADDNIIPEPDAALELGKSISKIEAEITEEERRIHETHERLVTAKPTSVDESDGEPANRPTGRRRPSGINFRDTSNVSKKKSLDLSQKLKGIHVVTDEEQLVTDTKKAIKASKEVLRLQQQTEDSSEGAEVLDEGKDEITWLSTDEEEKGNEDDDEEDNDRSIDIEETDDERTDSENGDQAMTNVDKNIAKKLEEEKGDKEEEQAIDDQAQKDQVENDIVGTLVTMSHKEKPKATTTTTPTPLTTPLPTPPITITTQLVTSPLPATKTLDALVPLLEALTAVLKRVSTLEKDVKELKQVNHSIVIFKLIRSQVPPTVNEFLESSLGDSLQKVLQKHTKELKQQESQKSTSEVIKIKQEHASKQKWPKHSTTPFDKDAKNEHC